MIVIAAYNQTITLSKLLKSINLTIDFNEEVLVVCTDPTQKKMLTYLEKISKKNNFNYNLLIDKVNSAGYDTGAYIYAYKKYVRDYYIFLQDSLIVKNPNWFNLFLRIRNTNSLNAWFLFNLKWDNLEQKKWVVNKFPKNIKTPCYGIFGPIFQISRKAMKKIDNSYKLSNFIPSNKIIGQQGMERGWSYLAINSGVEINSLEGFFDNIEDEKANIQENLFNSKNGFNQSNKNNSLDKNFPIDEAINFSKKSF